MPEQKSTAGPIASDAQSGIEDQLWPIACSTAVLMGVLTAVISVNGDFDDERLLFNGYTQLLGVAGLGRIGLMHAQNIAGPVRTAELSRVVDFDEARARSAGEELGVEWSTDYSDLLADPAVEGVVIATPTEHHVRMVELAAEVEGFLIDFDGREAFAMTGQGFGGDDFHAHAVDARGGVGEVFVDDLAAQADGFENLCAAIALDRGNAEFPPTPNRAVRRPDDPSALLKSIGDELRREG